MKKYLRLLLLKILYSKITYFLPDQVYLRILYQVENGRKLNLKRPKLFTEKIQWLKLYDRNPIYTQMADKIVAKDYVKRKIGEQYIIPTLKVWNTPKDIDINILPNKFVMKCNHNSGGIIICEDKNKLDEKYIKKSMERAFKQKYYIRGREWAYKYITPHILVEKFMEDEEIKGLNDYKFYCFNGTPKFCQVIADRYQNETIDFYDMNWSKMEFTGLSCHNRSKKTHQKPEAFEEMKKISKKLAEGTKFVRVDLYFINKKVYFGEMTFYPSSGFGFFDPKKWDRKLGDMLRI